MSKNELHYLTATEITTLYTQKKLSPVEVTEAYLNRIEAMNDDLGAYITVDYAGAREAAKLAEDAYVLDRVHSPLTGVPIGLKDIIHIKDMRTTSGSRVTADYVADEDSTIVERLRAAGAVILGKLNLSEFAIGGTIDHPFGTPRNPWNTRHATGGSSSGSAVAVAAGLCAVALGSDTGGSIRGPASFCGIAGIRPTYGLVTRHGAIPMSWSYDTIGPMTRTVEDSALVLRAIAGHDPRDDSTLESPVPDYLRSIKNGVKTLRIGLPREMFDYQGLNNEVKSAVENAVRKLEKLGASAKKVSVPTASKTGAVFIATGDVDAAAYHREWLRERGDDYDWSTRVRLESASLTPTTAYIRAQRIRALIRKELLTVLSEVDVLALPTMASTAPTLEDGTGKPGGFYQDSKRDLGNRQYMSLPSAAGLPAITVPCGFNKAGLPIGLQLIGRPMSETTLFRAAYAYEQATGHHRKHPSL